MRMISGGSRRREVARALVVAAVVWCAYPAFAIAATRRPTPRVALPPPSSYVLDLTTHAVRTSERADIVRPIASLTKLMTAMVLLESHANLERSATYDPKRHAAYRNWMGFERGDRLRGRDLFVAMLVGSQNIPACMLVGLTPYAEGAFIARMNAKARSLGLARTRFVDVHGLSPKNVSTAAEVAQLLDAAFAYPDIRDALGRDEATVSWRTRRGAPRLRTFHHTNPLLQDWQRFATEASKTGYLDEAGDAIAMRVRDPRTGRRFTVVTLGEPRRHPRFSLARRLAEAAVATQRIAGTE